MYFDNLTITGVLVTFPSLVMVIRFSRVQTRPVPQETFVSEKSGQESYCYGT